MKIILSIVVSILMVVIVFLGCKESKPFDERLILFEALQGNWKAKAFDGELHDEWFENNCNWMVQHGHYIENNDTTYSAISKVEKVGEDIILFSVIKNSTPKIFKAIDHSEKMVLFENKDYKNPYEVKYEFISNNKYRRTIKGIENDSLVSYTFNFERIQ